jgi:hypothetical protein
VLKSSVVLVCAYFLSANISDSPYTCDAYVSFLRWIRTVA